MVAHFLTLKFFFAVCSRTALPEAPIQRPSSPVLSVPGAVESASQSRLYREVVMSLNQSQSPIDAGSTHSAWVHKWPPKPQPGPLQTPASFYRVTFLQKSVADFSQLLSSVSIRSPTWTHLSLIQSSQSSKSFAFTYLSTSLPVTPKVQHPRWSMVSYSQMSSIRITMV